MPENAGFSGIFQLVASASFFAGRVFFFAQLCYTWNNHIPRCAMEQIISGYCRQLDQARIVMVEIEHGELVDVDCSFETCPNAAACPIGQQISEALQ